ncbi:MAG TPA: hypothetical protein VF731_13885 [Solirubrobacterales bacterium]
MVTGATYKSLPRQTPYKRIYPSGNVVWIARYYDQEGKVHYAKPAWNRGKASFKLRREAQEAINDALCVLYGVPLGTLHWTEKSG